MAPFVCQLTELIADQRKKMECIQYYGMAYYGGDNLFGESSLLAPNVDFMMVNSELDL